MKPTPEAKRRLKETIKNETLKKNGNPQKQTCFLCNVIPKRLHTITTYMSQNESVCTSCLIAFIEGSARGAMLCSRAIDKIVGRGGCE